MSPKSVICCLAATAFVATTALMPTGAPLVVVAARAMCRNREPGTGRPNAEGGNMSLHYDHRYHHCWWRHGYRHCW